MKHTQFLALIALATLALVAACESTKPPVQQPIPTNGVEDAKCNQDQPC